MPKTFLQRARLFFFFSREAFFLLLFTQMLIHFEIYTAFLEENVDFEGRLFHVYYCFFDIMENKTIRRFDDFVSHVVNA